MKEVIKKIRGFYNLAKEMGRQELLPNWEEQESRISNKEAKAIIDFYEQHRWIPIEEQLPPDSDTSIQVTDRDETEILDACDLHKSSAFWNLDTITHWRHVTLP